MVRRFKKMISIISVVGILCIFPANCKIATQAASGYYTLTEIENIGNRIIQWKKDKLGLTGNESLIEKGLASAAGTFDSDWLAFAIKRFQSGENTPDFITSLNTAMISNIKENKTPTIITDMHRSILTLAALGQDPRDFKIPEDSRQINLLSEYVYNRTIFATTDEQVINRLSWSLIAIDSMQYEIPQNSVFSRDILIIKILKQQKAVGGFSLMATSKASDPDITAMVIQSLAPYYNSDKAYTYERAIDKVTVTKTVRQVVDESLLKLSTMQTATGDYQTYWSGIGSRTVESAAQVALALCRLGIDPQKDLRFIKNGKTLMDGIMSYSMPDGGFSHEFPTTKSDHMTSAQVMCTMAAISRQMKGMRTLFDLRQEQSDTLKSSISQIVNKITQISDNTSRAELLAISSLYNSIVDNERMYVYNYSKLSDALKKSGIVTSSITTNEVSIKDSKITTSESSLESDIVNSFDATLPESSEWESNNESSYVNSNSGIDDPDSVNNDKKKNRVITTSLSILAILIILITVVYINKKKGSQ